MAEIFEWQPGVWYEPGVVVDFRGIQYEAVQEHTAEPGWEPPATPNLWVIVPGYDDYPPPPPPEAPYDPYAGVPPPPVQAWDYDQWFAEADARAQAYYNEGPNGPLSWVLSQDGNVPDGALVVGEQAGQPLFVVRTFYEGGIQIGKVSPGFRVGAVISYASEEIPVPTYEVLVGDRYAVTWVDAWGRLDPGQLGYDPVEGGREADGTPLFVVRAQFGDAIVPGKAGPGLEGARVAISGGEQFSESYAVLCYA